MTLFTLTAFQQILTMVYIPYPTPLYPPGYLRSVMVEQVGKVWLGKVELLRQTMWGWAGQCWLPWQGTWCYHPTQLHQVPSKPSPLLPYHTPPYLTLLPVLIYPILLSLLYPTPYHHILSITFILHVSLAFTYYSILPYHTLPYLTLNYFTLSLLKLTKMTRSQNDAGRKRLVLLGQIVCVCVFGFNVAFNNFSVISRRCLVATGSSMLTFIVLPH